MIDSCVNALVISVVSENLSIKQKIWKICCIHARPKTGGGVPPELSKYENRQGSSQKYEFVSYLAA